MPGSGVDWVYLARHGRTALNADGRLRGLSALSPTVVITRPLQRAVSTAEAIGAAAHIRVGIDQRLNDRHRGPRTGEPRAQAEELFGSVDAASRVAPADGVAARAVTAFTELTRECSDGPLVMVSHDAFNTALLRMLDPSLDGINQRTACYNQISRREGRWRVDFYDRKPQ